MAAFEERLSAIQLRAYLKKLPDFEDVEAEKRAMRHALDFRSFPTALDFLRGWPDQARAARLVLTRAAEIDGNLYYLLVPAAQLIEGKHPLAATLLRRATIEDTLDGTKSSATNTQPDTSSSACRSRQVSRTLAFSRRTRPSPAVCTPSMAERLASGLR